MLYIKRFESLSQSELYTILQLRNDIFVVEQNCPYLDIDDLDQHSFHIFLTHNSQIIAYARLIDPDIVYSNSAAIGRVLVKQAFRHQGHARTIIKACIHHALKTYESNTITLSAQSYLIDFYQSLGFSIIGDAYLEDGIPHIKMMLRQKK
jgi:ElaA protein